MDAIAAWERLAQAETIHIVNGRTITTWQPTPTNQADILAQAIGRSGTLRAPTIQYGRIILIGYHPDLYASVMRNA